VLFGRLKNGGTVRVVVTAGEDGIKKLGFVYPEGPVLPRPERDIVEASKKRVRPEPEVRRAKSLRHKGEDGGDEDEGDDLAGPDIDEAEAIGPSGEPESKH
jgi:ATP-dependent Clp protease ATP-binding subunit ClpA